MPFVAPDALGEILPKLTVAVLSPGIPLNGELVRRIQAADVPVFSEIEVAYRICKAPIVAVTGTKGKSTTTALIGAHLRGSRLHDARRRQHRQRADRRDARSPKPDDWVIAEVSSFQLESIRSFKPRISCIINITPDHLDRYHSMDEYAEAKFRIFANQGPGDTFVGNLDDPIVARRARARTTRASARGPLWFAREPHRQTTLYMRNENAIVYAPPTGDPRPVEIMTWPISRCTASTTSTT